MLSYVTGAAGFIGSHLVDHLLSEGHRVIGSDNLARGKLANLRSALGHPEFRFVQVDIADQSAVERVLHPIFRAEMEAVDTVWHMAANSDIAAGVAEPTVDLRDTFQTTFETLLLARQFKMRNFAFASTSAVYGERQGPLAEDTGPLLPISAYGAMKLAGEGIVSAAVESYLERSWMFRFPNVVGSRGTHGVIIDLIDKLGRDATKLEVLGDGTQQKPYLHVSELVQAMFYIWTHASERRALYNIGPQDEGARVSFIAEAVVSASNSGARLSYTGGDRGWVGDVPRVLYSVDKLRDLGWRPSVGSEAAILRAVNELWAEQTLP